MTPTYNPDNSSSPRPRKQPLRNYLAIIVVAFGISLLLSPPAAIWRTEQAVSSSETADLPNIATADQLTITLAQTFGRGSKVGIAAKDLTTGEGFELADNRKFDAASTMKLIIVGYMYHEASNNQFDLDEVLTIPAGDVQRYGTGVIQYQAGPYQYSYRELARLMMEKSDNTAAYVLANNLDKTKLQEFANGQGLTDTSIDNNTTTARDLVRFLERLHANEMAEPALTNEMLSILDDSDFEDRLRAKLPKETTVYHKTGDAFNGGSHDAGLVIYQNHVYAVAIFTEGLGSREVAAPKIASASRDIFAYFNRSK